MVVDSLSEALGGRQADSALFVCRQINKQRKKHIIEILGYLVEWFNAPATVGGFDHPDRRPNLGCWLRSGFESSWGRLVVSLFTRSYQMWTLQLDNVTCFD